MCRARMMRIVIVNDFSIYIYIYIHYIFPIFFIFLKKSSGLYNFYYREGQGEVRQQEACV